LKRARQCPLRLHRSSLFTALALLARRLGRRLQAKGAVRTQAQAATELSCWEQLIADKPEHAIPRTRIDPALTRTPNRFQPESGS
jgi:hypothetical protein